MSQAKKEGELVTPKEAANLLGVTRATLYYRSKRYGKPKQYCFDGRIAYYRTEVIKFKEDLWKR